MQATINWVNIGHEIDFSAPLFDLADRSTEVLRRFHDGVSSKYPIRSENMWISKGARLSEAKARIDLFDGNGLIEVTTDRLSVNFSYIQSAEQATICRECISLSERALREVFPDVAVSVVAFNSSYSLSLDGETASANQYLSRAAQPSFKGDMGPFGSVRAYPLVSLDVDNDEEHWNAFFSARGMGKDRPMLSVSCLVSYDKDAAIHCLEERLQHIERLSSAFLNGLDLDVTNTLFGMAEAK